MSAGAVAIAAVAIFRCTAFFAGRLVLIITAGSLKGGRAQVGSVYVLDKVAG